MQNQDIGIVIIGRNEGERLHRCLQSVITKSHAIVYVDSGSIDTSVAYAKSLGIDVVHLDMSKPFSAGRARNAGFRHLVQFHRGLSQVQFVDGDCELIDGWIDFAQQHLEENSQWAIVAGVVIERYPQQSIYNRLCDIEWKSQIGELQTCGGIFMVRVAAFLEVDGFNPEVIAGEEPELCYRLRQKGWKIFSLNHDMTLHDAAITRFSQWWKRSIRSGHAYAQGLMLHGKEREHYCLRDSLRIWWWGLIAPATISLIVLLLSHWCLILFAIYPIQMLNIALSKTKTAKSFYFSLQYAFFITIGKFPQLHGQVLFFIKNIFNKNLSLIEYK